MRFLPCLLALTLFAPLAPAQPVPELPPRVVAPTDQAQFRRLVLDNGIKVLLVSDPKFNKSAAALVVPVGQIDDPRDSEGLAHFLEHMLFLGTDKYPDEGEYGRFIQRNGGTNNAYTSSDHTNYHFDVRHDVLPEALDRFAQFFIAPKFNPEFVGREVNAVHNEAMRHVQNDFRRIISVLRELYDPTSGESKFSTGNRDTLARANPAAVRAFYEQHYSADRMALSIAGRVSLDELEKLARTNFSAIPKRNVKVEPHAPTFLPRKAALRLARVEPVRELRQLTLEFLTPPTRPMFASRSDRLLDDLLQYAGPGGLLAQLKAEGLANNVNASFWERTPQYGSLLLTLDLTPAGEREHAKVLQRVFAWIEFLRRAPFPREFHADRARIGALSETYDDRGEGMELVTQLANNALFYPLAVAERAHTAWGAPDEAAYRRLLDVLVPENMLAVLAARGVKTDRRERIYNVAYAYEEDAGAAFAALKQPPAVASFALPGANRFMPQSTALLPERAQSLIDEPGLALHYAPDTEFLRPQTSVVMRFVPVREIASADSDALLTLWGRALQDALEADIADARAAGVQINTEFGLEGIKLGLHGFGDAPARFARHVAARLRSFSVSAERYAAVQEQVVRALSSYAQTEAYQLGRDRREAMQREFRFLPDQTLPRVKSAGWPEVQRFGARLLERGKLEVLIHGHLAPEGAVAAARAIAASVGARPAPAGELMRRRNLVMSPGEHIVDAGLIQGVNSAWSAEVRLGTDSPRVRAAALVLNAFVSPPFYNEMRTRQQLGYIVGSGPTASLRERGLVFVIQSSTHAAGDVQQRAEAVIAGLPAALAALGNAEWATLKAGVRSQLEEKPTSIAERADRLFNEAYLYGGEWGRAQASLAALEALTQAEAATLLAEAIDPGKGQRRSVLLDRAAQPPATPVASSFTDREAWKRGRQYR
jgi:secreted Zn-dependent insulinase-like peptidase